MLPIIALMLFVQPAQGQDLKAIVIAAAEKYNVDAVLFVAIVQQESNFETKAYNPKSQDYGLAQINYKTARAYGLNTHRLLHDSKYNAEAGARILADIQNRYGYKEPQTWFCRYNVGSGRLIGTKAARCIKYVNLVMRHYKGGTYAALEY